MKFPTLTKEMLEAFGGDIALATTVLCENFYFDRRQRIFSRLPMLMDYRVQPK